MKLNEEQLKNIDIIKQAYEKLNAPDDTPRLTVLLSTAMIESSLKSNQKNYQCKYCGIYQLSEGYNNECEKTEDRFDIEKSTNCTYNIMLQNKKRWEKEKISKWKDYMYYLMHQQGFSGFKYIYNNRNKKIKNMRNDIIKNITGNIPLKDGKKVITENNVGQDFINIWEKRFEELTKEFQTIVGEKKDIKANEKNKLKVFYTGIGLTALGGLTYYFIIQDKKNNCF